MSSCDHDEAGVGFGMWQTKKQGESEWRTLPATLAPQWEWAFAQGKERYTFTLDGESVVLRGNDGNGQSYTVDFTTMKQTNDAQPSRVREVRRVERLDVRLERNQLNAIHYVEKTVYENAAITQTRITERLARLGLGTWDELDLWMNHHAPIIIHVKLSNTVKFFLDDPYYRNLFETNTGRGSTEKDKRAQWEDRMFNCYYRKAAAKDKPKYGTLNMTGDRLGVKKATCYGTSYFKLKPSIRWRCTFTSRDSACRQFEAGTARQFARFLSELSDEELAMVAKHTGEPAVLKNYAEVQIHGPVRLAEDVEECVADIELTEDMKSDVRELGRRYGFPVKFDKMHDIDDTYFGDDRLTKGNA